MAHEGLGPDFSLCKQHFIAAVQDQLAHDLLAASPGDPGAERKAAEKAQSASIQNSFTPLADAVYRIVTVSAKVSSDPASDTAFWQWVAALNAWLVALGNWQLGVARAFATWAPTQPAERNLKNALTSVAQPGPPPTRAPLNLSGRIE
jgi:hypothetical protein